MNEGISERMEYWLRRARLVRYEGGDVLALTPGEYRELRRLDGEVQMERIRQGATGVVPIPDPGEPVTEQDSFCGMPVVAVSASQEGTDE